MNAAQYYILLNIHVNHTNLGGTVPIWVLMYLRTVNVLNSTALNIVYDFHTGSTNLKKRKEKQRIFG